MYPTPSHNPFARQISHAHPAPSECTSASSSSPSLLSPLSDSGPAAPAIASTTPSPCCPSPTSALASASACASIQSLAILFRRLVSAVLWSVSSRLFLMTCQLCLVKIHIEGRCRTNIAAKYPRNPPCTRSARASAAATLTLNLSAASQHYVCETRHTSLWAWRVRCQLGTIFENTRAPSRRLTWRRLCTDKAAASERFERLRHPSPGRRTHDQFLLERRQVLLRKSKFLLGDLLVSPALISTHSLSSRSPCGSRPTRLSPSTPTSTCPSCTRHPRTRSFAW
jgi:hypothetical protein